MEWHYVPFVARSPIPQIQNFFCNALCKMHDLDKDLSDGTDHSKKNVKAALKPEGKV
jgi:hypothetical protein